MAAKSKGIIGALDGIRDAIITFGSSGGIEFPQLAINPAEEVLAFNNDEHHKLEGFPPPSSGKPPPYFSATGNLTDLAGRPLPGGRIEASFPLTIKANKIEEVLTSLPNPQVPPFDGLPVDGTNTETQGPSKRAHYFGDGSSIVTVGFSTPKVYKLKSGGALFWVNVLGVVSQGSGKYEGARGLGCSVGTAFFAKWPDKLEDQVKLLVKGFDVKVAAFLKVTRKENLP